jgi:hypothetical protein
VFVFDRRRDTLELLSRSSDGEQGDNDSFAALVSGDGRFVVFTSRASNLVRHDTNQQFDVFLRDRERFARGPLWLTNAASECASRRRAWQSGRPRSPRRPSCSIRNALCASDDIASSVARILARFVLALRSNYRYAVHR